MKKSYIEYLRLMATLAVVMIHITMTEVNNSTISQIGAVNYAIYNIGYTLTKWAVPIFIMITGNLLLSPDKEITTKKIINYIARMVVVLLIFGTAFAAMEIVFSEGLSEWYLIIPKSLLFVLEEKSWDHLWYLYLLIGLYILTPFTKAAIKNLGKDQLLFLIFVIYVINFIRPAINLMFNININDLWIKLSGYYGYYLLGYYLSIEDNRFYTKRKLIYLLAIIMMAFMIIYDTIKIILFSNYSLILRDANPFIPIIAIAIFLFVKSKFGETRELNKIFKSINNCSFGIYLFHPLFVNIFYKVIGFTPRNLPIVLGILLLWLVIFLLSWLFSFILKRFPFFEKLL